MCSPFLNTGLLVCVLGLLGGCGQDRDRRFSPGTLVEGNRQSTLQPGPSGTLRPSPNPIEPTEQILGEGKQLYNQFNCSGCHAAGGGAIGPPLMDDEWIYGSSPRNIFWTIIEGRPQGMPAFGGRIAGPQVWRIVAYVRSLSDLPKVEAGSPQPQPSASAAERGRQVFLEGPCVMCHSIRGTIARSAVGPDLTHVASRRMLAAGTFPNTTGHLMGWILNPQNLKPGSRMPPSQLSPADADALVAYLKTLQ